MSTVLSLEVFLSRKGVCLAVPVGCGLDQADSLRVDIAGRRVAAIRHGSELPIDLPLLSVAHCEAIAQAGEVAVGEFVVQGVKAAYILKVG